jgi:hypothetical protein
MKAAWATCRSVTRDRAPRYRQETHMLTRWLTATPTGTMTPFATLLETAANEHRAGLAADLDTRAAALAVIRGAGA